MIEFEFSLPNPTENTTSRCNELLMVYSFKTIIDKINPEFAEPFIRTNALVFGLKEKDISFIFSVIKNDLTMFTVKEVCVCAYYLDKAGLRRSETLGLFGIKKGEYIRTLRLYNSYDNCSELEPKIPKENLLALNSLIEKLNNFSEVILTTNKTLRKIKGEI